MPGLFGTGRRVGSLLAVLSLLAVSLALTTPMAAAQTTGCLVSIAPHQGVAIQLPVSRSSWGDRLASGTTPSTYSSLQAAVDAAQSGDTLLIQGTCLGTTTISKDLTLTGTTVTNHLRGTSAATPTLDGNQQGSVLTTLAETTVRINNLVITGGSTNDKGGGIMNGGTVVVNSSRISGNEAYNGGGISTAGGTVILTDTRVSGNQATGGGGLNITQSGTAILNGTTSISGNSADHEGGGIQESDSAVTMNDWSSVNGNSAYAGGGISSDHGIVTMNDRSSISGNNANPGDLGGGADLNYSTMIMNDWSSIHGNTAGIGGGVELGHGALTMNDWSSIHDNTAYNNGGGISDYNYLGTLTNCIDGVNVFNNSPDNIVP